jgi:hypothetical protein
MFRITTMRRAMLEGMLIFLCGPLLALVPATFWPWWLFPLVLVVRLVFFILPPVWVAMRVRSTKREKMSRRFWRLGPTLAGWCTLASLAIALFVGEASLFGGVATTPDITRFAAHGAQQLGLGAFIAGTLLSLVGLSIYYTIAVVCTRLANGGFLRFTMPAGKGRVTL